MTTEEMLLASNTTSSATFHGAPFDPLSPHHRSQKVTSRPLRSAKTQDVSIDKCRRNPFISVILKTERHSQSTISQIDYAREK